MVNMVKKGSILAHLRFAFHILYCYLMQVSTPLHSLVTWAPSPTSIFLMCSSKVHFWPICNYYLTTLLHSMVRWAPSPPKIFLKGPLLAHLWLIPYARFHPTALKCNMSSTIFQNLPQGSTFGPFVIITLC